MAIVVAIITLIGCSQPPAYNRTEVTISEKVKLLEQGEDVWLLEVNRGTCKDTVSVPVDSTYRLIEL